METPYGYIEPQRVFGSIFFVGTHAASTHIIDTGEGLIMIDPGMPDSLALVVGNMNSLGFSERDIKIILLSHGHYDHAGAAAELRTLSGAPIYIGEGDGNMVMGIEDTALSPDPNYAKKYSFTPDFFLRDGDTVSLGNTEITCLSTPGHSDGTMSFFFNAYDGEKTCLAGMHGGVGTNTLTADFMKDDKRLYEKRQKYIKGIENVEKIDVQVFLGNHVGNNQTEQKLKRVKSGESDAFIAPDEWKSFLKGRKERLRQIISKESVMQNTINKILKEKIVVIVRGVEREALIPFAEAIYKGGIRLLECTYDATGKISDEEMADRIKMLADHFGDRMEIGAGTVLTEQQVELTKKAGGKFIISPDTNAAVIAKTKKEGLVSIPGALTPSEATAAHRAGADFVKLFPVGSMGAGYLKDVKAPLSHIRFLAVGGVDSDNMNEYFSRGACGIGVGSSIVNKELISLGKWDEITALAKKYTEKLG